MTERETIADPEIDAGDVVCWSDSFVASKPRFARVHRRTRCMLVIEELVPKPCAPDGASLMAGGCMVPTPVGMGTTRRCHADRDGTCFNVDGHRVFRWDGVPVRHDDVHTVI